MRVLQFEPGPLDDKRADPQEDARDAFRARVAHGRYDALLAEPLQRVLREGAATRGVEPELGAIRFALAKLLAEELDASKLAVGVARLTSATVPLLKLDQVMGDATDESLATLLDGILIDLEKESREEREVRRGWRDSGS